MVISSVVAAKTVRMALDAGFDKIEDLKLEDLKKASDLIEEDIYQKITPRACMEGRKTTGGPSPECTEVQIKAMKDFCAKNRRQ